MSGHLNDAVHQLDLCATGCHYLAHGITENLASAQDHKPPTVHAPPRRPSTRARN